MAAIVERAVILTDNAKLDLDKKTITLEAVPPGQLETKINPRKSSRDVVEYSQGLWCSVNPYFVQRITFATESLVMPIHSLFGIFKA